MRLQFSWAMTSSHCLIGFLVQEEKASLPVRKGMLQNNMVSIPDGVIAIIRWHNPSGRTVKLGSAQTLTEMSIRNVSWGIKTVGD